MLLDLLEAITNVVLGVESASQSSRLTRASNLDLFLDRFETGSRDEDIEGCGDGSFCSGEAVLVAEVHPLMAPDRTGIAEAALEQLEENGVSIDEITLPHTGVLSFAGSSPEGAMQGRVIPTRGWVFLIIGEPGKDTETLSRLLDSTIESFEGLATKD